MFFSFIPIILRRNATYVFYTLYVATSLEVFLILSTYREREHSNLGRRESRGRKKSIRFLFGPKSGRISAQPNATVAFEPRTESNLYKYITELGDAIKEVGCVK